MQPSPPESLHAHLMRTTKALRKLSSKDLASTETGLFGRAPTS